MLHRETGSNAVRFFDTGTATNACVGDIAASDYLRIVEAAIAIYDERMGPELPPRDER